MKKKIPEERAIAEGVINPSRLVDENKLCLSIYRALYEPQCNLTLKY